MYVGLSGRRPADLPQVREAIDQGACGASVDAELFATWQDADRRSMLEMFAARRARDSRFIRVLRTMAC